jgi:hypothetical protein
MPWFRKPLKARLRLLVDESSSSTSSWILHLVLVLGFSAGFLGMVAQWRRRAAIWTTGRCGSVSSCGEHSWARIPNCSVVTDFRLPRCYAGGMDAIEWARPSEALLEDLKRDPFDCDGHLKRLLRWSERITRTASPFGVLNQDAVFHQRENVAMSRVLRALGERGVFRGRELAFEIVQ